jgi:hypothetical protein
MRDVSFRTTSLIITTMLLVPLLTSCMMRRPAGIAASTGPVTSTYTVLGPVEDTTCNYRYLIIPVFTKDPTYELIDKMLKGKGADALVGVVVEDRSAEYGVYASSCTVVKGLAVKISK